MLESVNQKLTSWKAMFPRPSRLDATFQYRHHEFKERNYQASDMQIADGQLTVFAGYEWRCWLGILQGPMVFVGLWPIGVRDSRFSYGRPWVWEADLLLDALLRHRKEIPIERSQIIDIFRDSLESKKVPLRSVIVMLVKVRLLLF